MYGYDEMIYDITQLKLTNIEVFNIGISCGGKIIPCIHVGKNRGNQIVITGAIHGREHITGKLVMKLAEHYSEQNIDGGIYFLPITNPDGVDLAIKGINSVKSYWDREFLLVLNGQSQNFELWKANLCGVDLNVNFPARFGTGVQNVTKAGAENFIGCRPLCEPESKALADFIKKVKPACVLCYHCKGEVIFWKFHQEENLLRDRIIAECLSEHTGYALESGEGSAGGLKDWCIQELKIPAFTIEVGSDSFLHPFPYSELDKIFKQNLEVPRIVLDLINDM